MTLGARRENITVTDIEGVVYRGRTALMDPRKEIYARDTTARTLREVIGGADIFLGTAPAAAILGVIRSTLTSWEGQVFGQIGLLVAVIVVVRVLPRGLSAFIIQEQG